MSGKQRATRAAELLEGVRRSSDTERAAAGEIEWLERATETAERWQAQEEEFLARAIELMRRTEQARGAATRAANERSRIERDRGREKERLRKNALARERYAERRRREAARVDKRTGMHALAIEVDPAAYRAAKTEALRRCSTVPKVIGEILGDPSQMMTCAAAPGPRWSRTNEGRRANQHTRIEMSDDAWRAIRVVAARAGKTRARWIGLVVEAWARDVVDAA